MHSPNRIASIIDFAAHLHTKFEQDLDATLRDFPDVLPYTATLPLAYPELTKVQRASTKHHAIAIWNLCNIVSEDASVQVSTAAAKSRALCCLLLSSLVPRNKGEARARLLEISATAAKCCLHAGLVELTAQILDNDVLPISSILGEPTTEAVRISPESMVEFLSLKMILCWKDERMDLAELWYSRIEVMTTKLGRHVSEKIVDLLFEIGSASMAHQGFHEAAKWLGRAQAILEHQDHLAHFARTDVKLNILHRLAQALAGLSRQQTATSHEFLHRAHKIITQLRSEYGPKLQILLLSLETRLDRSNVDINLAVEDLKEVTMTAHVEPNHSLIMYYLRKLWSMHASQSAECLRYYITHRLRPHGKIDLLDQAIVSYLEMYLTYNSTNVSEDLQNLRADLTSFQINNDTCLGSVAAQASHLLIWQAICRAEDEDSQSTMMLLCQIGIHPLLSSAVEGSTARFERQLIKHHLMLKNYAAATEILDRMTLVQKSNKHSRFLSYCAAIRSGNEIEAQSSLNAILNGSGDNDQLLHACVGESIEQGRTCDTARVLQRLADEQLKSAPTSDTKDLLKLTITTLAPICRVQQTEAAQQEECRARFCSAFESATSLQRRLQAEGKAGSGDRRHDWKWFSDYSFETALLNLRTWPRKFTVDLLHYSNQFLLAEAGHLAESTLLKDQRQRLFDCDFMRIILYASEIRGMNGTYSIEDLPKTSYSSRSRVESDYRHVLQKQVFDIYSSLVKRQQSAITIDDGERQETLSRLHILMPSAFEALLYMSASSYVASEAMFDEMGAKQFLQMADELEANPVTFALLADVVLALASKDSEAQVKFANVRVPSLSAARMLGHIVKSLREGKHYDLDQAARWIRCIVQLVLEDIESAIETQDLMQKIRYEQGLTMLQTLVHQVGELATSISIDMMEIDNVETSIYPSDELQWLASRLFNLSVDLYLMKQKELAQTWALEALKVANTMYRVCGTVAAKQLIDLLEQKMSTMRLEVRTE